jgi:C2 domain
MKFECVRIFPRWGNDAVSSFEGCSLSSPASSTQRDASSSASAHDDSTRSKGNTERISQPSPSAAAAAATKTRILLDVVGARGLRNHDGIKSARVDPYCAVRVSDRLVHQTHAIPNDADPVWTVESASLCLLEVADKVDDSSNEDVALEVRTGSRLLFEPVRIPAKDLLAAAAQSNDAQRREIPLAPVAAKESSSGTEAHCNASLSIQFRLASSHDAQVLDRAYRRRTKSSPAQPNSVAADWRFVREGTINLPLIRGPRKGVRKRTRATDGGSASCEPELVQRVQPGPDPARRAETEWLTRDEIQHEALKPSTVWHSARGGGGGGRRGGLGSGTDAAPCSFYGTIRLEVLGCDRLPRLDLTDKSDPFGAVLYENNLLRTDVIWNCQSPRWMPWSARAFELPVRHPHSLLFVAVFDYDASPVIDSSVVNAHDPVGRIVLHPGQFEPNVTHVLSYPLDGHGDGQPTAAKAATVKIRLRVEWDGGGTVPPVALVAPPRYVLHVEFDRSFQVLRYLARGSLDMDQASVASVRSYGDELLSYVTDYCYFLDVLFEVFLWRGRARLFGYSVWFPIHSFVLFCISCLCLEYPKKTPAFLLYGIVWILMSTQYHESRHPNPWKRVKALDQRFRSVVFGGSCSTVPPNAGVAEERRQERLDVIKGRRMARLIYQSLMFCLSVYRVYSKTSAPIIITEPKDWSLLSGRLYYLHLFLQYLCTYIRSFRNFVHWRAGSSTQRLAGYCLLLAVAWTALPVHRVAHWTLRVWIWTFGGPWMNLVDVLWVKHWYRTKEQLLDAIDAGEGANDEGVADKDLPDFDAWLRSDVLIRMGHRGRLVAEESRKQLAWRRVLLGTYSERVPTVDSSRYPSTPLPSSFSRAELLEAAAEDIVFVPGQELVGTMIPTFAHETE